MVACLGTVVVACLGTVVVACLGTGVLARLRTDVVASLGPCLVPRVVFGIADLGGRGRDWSTFFCTGMKT